MTYAERSAQAGRDDANMIYEMFHISQYSDGSVLDSVGMHTYTVAQVLDGAVQLPDGWENLKTLTAFELVRNAQKVLGGRTGIRKEPERIQ